MKINHGYDHTTAAGQIRLMRESVGQDYPAPLRMTAKVAEPEISKPELHPLVGKKVFARWLFGPEATRVTRTGVVSHVAETICGALRIVGVDAAGDVFRCYAGDPMWEVQFESTIGSRLNEPRNAPRSLRR